MNPFKVGDVIELNKKHYSIELGKHYVVTCVDPDYVGFKLTGKEYIDYPIRATVEGTKTNWGYSLFKLVENMNEIEVGDIINGKSYNNNQVVQVKSTYYLVFNLDEKAEGNYNEFYIQENAAVLVSKANKQEIVGYELLKDLPGIPAGTQVRKSATDEFSIFATSVQQLYIFRELQLQDTTWFKPIYKAKEVVVKISSDREVTLKDSKVYLNNQGVRSFQDIAQMHQWFIIPIYPGQVKINTITIGCQEFTLVDIEKVYQAIQNLK